MPASLPGSTLAQNQGNPSLGAVVTFLLLSGPKGSPFDYDKQKAPDGTLTSSGNCSTGGLSTGLGLSPGTVIGPTAPASIKAQGFTDDYKAGQSTPVPADAADSTYMHIGGGRSIIVGGLPGGASVPSPYTAGFGIGAAGNGGSRDAGAGPAFTGFPLKLVTASGAVAVGAAVESGFLNRSPAALVSGESTFGSSNTASAAPA